MGFLEKFWDDTVAGPRPDTGLGRLRKFPTFSIRTDFSNDPAEGGSVVEKSPVEEPPPKVTRSIMIRRPSGSPSSVNSTPPESPAGSTTPPISPVFGSAPGPGGREWNRFRRKSMSDAYERGGGGGGGRRGGFVMESMPPTPTSTVGIGSREI